MWPITAHTDLGLKIVTSLCMPGPSVLIMSVVIYFQGDAGQWQIVFYIAAGIYLYGAIVYGLLASGTRQKWAEVPTGYIPHRDGTEIEHED